MSLNITVNSVLQAMAEIDRYGVPEGREAKIMYVCKPNSTDTYPVKYVCELAHNSIKGNTPITFSNFVSVYAERKLEQLGFKIIRF